MAYRFLLALILLSTSALPLRAASLSKPFHLDRQKLPFGCGSCHVGFDFRSGGGQEGCLFCHGDPSRRRKGLVRSDIVLKDIEVELKKSYHHPLRESKGIHTSREQLPETNPRAPRHADCVDCHSPHQVSASNPFAVIRVKRAGNVSVEVSKEYELCYKCHAESANLPGLSVNKRAEFATTNPSFHPVEGEGRNLAVVSLIKPYKERHLAQTDISVIKCGACHGSNDPDSPNGPHGSTYQYLLRDNYSTRDNEAESIYAYALCYRCHSRSSILANESFKSHALHVRGKMSATSTTGGTSCHTCHTSHGSTEYKYLIRFNAEVVSPSSSGMLKFKEKGAGTFSGECYLTCHGIDHNPKAY